MSEWKIIDGNLPFIDEFPQSYEINDVPVTLWRIVDNQLPMRTEFPPMPTIDDAPDSLWKIVDGNLPYRTVFPQMYGVETRSNIYLDGKKMKTFFIGDDKVLKIYLGDKLVMG